MPVFAGLITTPLCQNRRILELKTVLRQFRSDMTAQLVTHQRLAPRELEKRDTQYSNLGIIPQKPQSDDVCDLSKLLSYGRIAVLARKMKAILTIRVYWQVGRLEN